MDILNYETGFMILRPPEKKNTKTVVSLSFLWKSYVIKLNPIGIIYNNMQHSAKKILTNIESDGTFFTINING